MTLNWGIFRKLLIINTTTMKNPKLIIITLFYGVVLLACKAEKPPLNLGELKETVQSDNLYHAYQLSSDSLLNLTLEGKIDIGQANKSLVFEQTKTAKNLDDLKRILTEAKIVGADELATLLFRQNQSVKKLIAKYPQLRELTPTDRNSVLGIKVQSSQASINASVSRKLGEK